MSQEIWKPVVGFEGQYEVSSLGRVRSLDRLDSMGRRKFGKLIQPHKLHSGHNQFRLWSENKDYKRTAHRLVMQSFVGPIPEGKIVCHGINGVSDNSLSNLYFGTHRKNLCEDLNRDKKFASKFPGVYKSKSKWSCKIRHNGTRKYLGTFDTEEEAFEAYKQARLEIGEPIE